MTDEPKNDMTNQINFNSIHFRPIKRCTYSKHSHVYAAAARSVAVSKGTCKCKTDRFLLIYIWFSYWFYCIHNFNLLRYTDEENDYHVTHVLCDNQCIHWGKGTSCPTKRTRNWAQRSSNNTPTMNFILSFQYLVK